MGEINLAKAIQRSEGMEQYDGHAKNLLTYKELMAVILQAVVHEFFGMTIEEIKRYTDDGEVIEMVEECLKSGSCESKHELAPLLERIHNPDTSRDFMQLSVIIP